MTTPATQPSKRRVIFLDIDGVLVNRKSLMRNSGWKAWGDSECVAHLNRILAETGAKIVVSSAWRISGLEEMRNTLKTWGVDGEVIGITPDLKDKERGHEIQAWLDEQRESIDFLILDDDEDMVHLDHRLVRSEFETGLTSPLAEKAIEMLKGNND